MRDARPRRLGLGAARAGSRRQLARITPDSRRRRGRRGHHGRPGKPAWRCQAGLDWSGRRRRTEGRHSRRSGIELLTGRHRIRSARPNRRHRAPARRTAGPLPASFCPAYRCRRCRTRTELRAHRTRTGVGNHGPRGTAPLTGTNANVGTAPTGSTTGNRATHRLLNPPAQAITRPRSVLWVRMPPMPIPRIVPVPRVVAGIPPRSVVAAPIAPAPTGPRAIPAGVAPSAVRVPGAGMEAHRPERVVEARVEADRHRVTRPSLIVVIAMTGVGVVAIALVVGAGAAGKHERQDDQRGSKHGNGSWQALTVVARA